MKYLSLDNEELKELVNLKKINLIVYLILLIAAFAVSYLIADNILSESQGVNPLAIAIFLVCALIAMIGYHHKNYVYDLIKKQKKVYKGVLSSKTKRLKENRYFFNMDGNIFEVEEDTYHEFEEGDIVEFHISSFTKHLFKVVKVS